jgi:transmembrane sensor
MSEDRGSESRKRVADAALAWWVKCDAGPLSRKDRMELDAWLAADPGHREAFEDAARMFGEVQRLWTGRAGAAPRRPIAIPAAALLAASLAFLVFYEELALRFRADALTAAGETRVVRLDDGSAAHLSARSALAIHYNAGERRLELLAGEVYFEAAPDAARPFVVVAAGATVTALGTAFDVALRDAAHAEVAVAVHSVAVASDGGRTIVSEGEQARFGAGAPTSAPERADLFKIGGWRRGRLIFEDEPLETVLATLSRYRIGYLVAAPAAKRLRVTGTFETANPAGAIRALETSLGLKSLSIAGYAIYLYK